MSKRDNKGGMPINFRVSENIDGKGARVSTPVNQPGWKYRIAYIKSKPSTFEWLAIGLVTTLFIFLVVAMSLSDPNSWIVSLFCALFPTLWIISAVSRTAYYSKEGKKQRE